MALESAHSFLVYPAKHHEDQPETKGTPIQGRGHLLNMLADLFDRARDECNIEIVFQPDDRRRQSNPCRDLLLSHLAEPTIESGRLVAQRLQQVTTLRSGLGLLFLLTGTNGRRHQLVVARFPADQGIIAEERPRGLSVEFVERVFMRSAKAYKTAVYQTRALGAGFWTGWAVDRQISRPRELSDYWVREFLLSELRTTGPAGTKRLALALRDAIRSTPELGIRRELIAAAELVRGHHGRHVTARQLVYNLGLSDEAIAAVVSGFPRPDLMDDAFELDRAEFERHAPYRAVELDNGGVLIAEDTRFSEVFRVEHLAVAENRVRYTTEGVVVDERLRRSR